MVTPKPLTLSYRKLKESDEIDINYTIVQLQVSKSCLINQ